MTKCEIYGVITQLNGISIQWRVLVYASVWDSLNNGVHFPFPHILRSVLCGYGIW